MQEFKEVDKFYNVIDEACMLLYEELNLDYLDAFNRVANDILEDIDDSRLTKEAIEKLEKIYAKLDDFTFTNDAIRQALNLILVKGLKHNGTYPLDLVGPDTIPLLISEVIKTYFDDQLSLFEANIGLGCNINTIANFIEQDMLLTGEEEDEKLCKIALNYSHMQDNDVLVLNNKILDPLDITFDCLIGYFKSEVKDGDFIPYCALNKFMKNLSEEGIFIITIDNDFFSYDSAAFKKSFTGTLLGLIVLPQEMFKSDARRSILIGSKMQLNDYDMFVYNLPSIKTGEEFVKTISKIDEGIKAIKEKIKEQAE